MEHWYVYYDCTRHLLEETVSHVRAMQGALAAECAVQGRLLQRADGQGTRITLMEIYEHIASPGQFGLALDEALAGSEVRPDLRSARHTERFRDI